MASCQESSGTAQGCEEEGKGGTSRVPGVGRGWEGRGRNKIVLLLEDLGTLGLK